jgi:hypothetical protein
VHDGQDTYSAGEVDAGMAELAGDLLEAEAAMEALS